MKQLLCLLLFGLLISAGCGGGGASSDAAQEASNAAPEEKAKRPPEKPEKRPAEIGAPSDISVTLDGHEGAQNVGILMAQKLGYFQQAHLTVSILLPLTPARSVHYVATGLDDIGVAQEPQVVLEKARGAQVAAIGSLISRPTAALIWLERSHIGGVGDLKGKTIATPGLPFQEAFLESLLKREGLRPGDVTIERANFGLLNALLSGRADAIFGGSGNLEGAELEALGQKPVVTGVHTLGVPAYDEFVVVARSDRVAREPRLIRAFMSAVVRGNAAAARDPKAAANAIMEADLGNFVPRRRRIEAEVAATSPLLSHNGYMNPEKAARLTRWMHEENMIEHEPPVAKLLTNRLR